MPVAASGPTAHMSVSPMAISHERDLALHAELVPLLQEGGQISRRQAADHHVRLGGADLQDEGAEIGGVQRHLVRSHLGSAGLLQQLTRGAQDVLTEGIGCGDMIPFLAVAQRVRRQHARLHLHRGVEPEGEAVAVLAGDFRRRRVIHDERDLQLFGGGFLGQRVGRQGAAEDGADLVLLHQLLHVLRSGLRGRLVQPDQFGRLAHDLVAALFQRQIRAVGEIFRLRRDLPGLGQQQADLDRLGGPGDVRHGQGRAGGERGRAEQGRAAGDDDARSRGPRFPDGHSSSPRRCSSACLLNSR